MPAPNNRICQVETCERRHWANNYCEKHNRQVRNHGHILIGNYLSEQGKKARTMSSGAKGTHWSEEAKQKFSEASKGITRNTGRTHFKKGVASWCKGLSNWMSAEHKEALIKANTGRPAWNKGKVHLAKEKNPAWKGGVQAQNDIDRAKFRKLYQDTVLARDDYTCQICDQYSGYLQVDHIKSWSKYPELRFDLDNCRTLCMACHYYVTFKRKMPKNTIWGHNFNKKGIN